MAHSSDWAVVVSRFDECLVFESRTTIPIEDYAEHPSYWRLVRDRERRPSWRRDYATELEANPKLSKALDEFGVFHICEAAGLTANERDATLLRASGLSWGAIQQAFIDEKSLVTRGAVQSYGTRGREKLRLAYIGPIYNAGG